MYIYLVQYVFLAYDEVFRYCLVSSYCSWIICNCLSCFNSQAASVDAIAALVKNDIITLESLVSFFFAFICSFSLFQFGFVICLYTVSYIC